MDTVLAVLPIIESMQPHSVMEILKTSIEWARAEVFSTRFFIIFAILFLISGVGFWYLGKTEIAKAYIIPTLVAGGLLMTIGLGLFYTNKARISRFEIAYQQDRKSFIDSEIVRAERTLKEYQTIVFKVIPIVIALTALIVFFVDKPAWRAGAITTMAMMIVILLIDGTAHGRMESYYEELQKVEQTRDN